MDTKAPSCGYLEVKRPASVLIAWNLECLVFPISDEAGRTLPDEGYIEALLAVLWDS